MNVSCWTWLSRALELQETGTCVLAPGVAIQRRGIEGRDVAVLYGGHKSSVDKSAVVESARQWIETWPEPVSSIEIFVTPDPPRNPWTRRGRAARGRA